MQVHNMDDCDWVAAANQEEAIEFYTKMTGAKKDEITVKKCNLKKDGMYTEINLKDAITLLEQLDSDGKVNNRSTVKFAYGEDVGLMVWVTFQEELCNHASKEPFIICSAEC